VSRASRVLAGASLGYINMALTTVASLWFTPFLLRRIGQQAYGLWAVGAPILTYVTMVDFGVLTLFEREVAFSIGSSGGDFRKAESLPTLVGKTLRLVLLQMPVLCLAAAIAWFAMPAAWTLLRKPFGVVLLTLVLCFPLRTSHALLKGLQDLAFIGKANIVTWAIGFVLGVVSVLMGLGLYALALSWCAAQIAVNVAYCVRVRTRFGASLPARLPPLAGAEAIVILRKGFWVVIQQLAGALLSGTDVLVIGAVLGPVAVVPYTITDKLVTLFSNTPLHFIIAAQPALSELKGRASRSRLLDVSNAVTQVVLMLSGFLACVIIAVDGGFVSWWVGSNEFAGNHVVLVLVITMLLSHWTTTTVSTIFAFGFQRLISFTAVLNGVVTLGLTVVLTRRFGLVGAPIAAIAGFVVIGLPAHLVVIARETDSTVGAGILALVPWAWRFVLVAAGAAVFAHVFVPSSFLTLAATSTMVALVYVGLMFPLAMREPLGPYVRPRIAALRARVAGRG
jgi:O-antigen/teichoic acid export membrane protein